MEKYVTYRID